MPLKTRTWIILLALVLLVCGGLSALLLLPGEPAAFARITSRGAVVEIADLSVEQIFTVDDGAGGSNTVTVRDGKIAVTLADCPDQYCVHQGFRSSGTPIVCLPHELIIEFVSDPGLEGAGADGVDGVVG